MAQKVETTLSSAFDLWPQSSLYEIKHHVEDDSTDYKMALTFTTSLLKGKRLPPKSIHEQLLSCLEEANTKDDAINIYTILTEIQKAMDTIIVHEQRETVFDGALWNPINFDWMPHLEVLVLQEQSEQDIFNSSLTMKYMLKEWRRKKNGRTLLYAALEGDKSEERSFFVKHIFLGMKNESTKQGYVNLLLKLLTLFVNSFINTKDKELLFLIKDGYFEQNLEMQKLILNRLYPNETKAKLIDFFLTAQFAHCQGSPKKRNSNAAEGLDLAELGKDTSFKKFFDVLIKFYPTESKFRRSNRITPFQSPVAIYVVLNCHLINTLILKNSEEINSAEYEQKWRKFTQDLIEGINKSIFLMNSDKDELRFLVQITNHHLRMFFNRKEMDDMEVFVEEN